MRALLPATCSLLLAASICAAPPPPQPATARTIKNLRNFPIAHLRYNITPKLYKSLAISPVTAWVVAEVQMRPGTEPKILQSDAGGQFDKLALELAKGWGARDYNTTESRTQRPTLNVHLLIYKLADGALMAVNFSHNDQAFYHGHQRTDVWIGLWKDGKWTTLGGTKHERQAPHPYG